jgi:hypothetical protein
MTQPQTSAAETASAASPIRGRKEGLMASTRYSVTLRYGLRANGRQVVEWTETVTLTGLRLGQVATVEGDWLTDVIAVTKEGR